MMKEFTRMTNLQKGFGLLELIIVLGLIAGLGAMVVPNLFRNQSSVARKELFSSLQSLMQDAVKYAVYKNQAVQVYFNFDENKVQLRIFDEESVEINKHKKFKDLKDDLIKTYVAWPSHIAVKNFVINGSDEVMSRGRLQDVWFYIMPDGTSQPVTVNIVDQNDAQQEDMKYSFVINPFYARMQIHEGFQQISA